MARCILSKFYIKPQPSRCRGIRFHVVSYRNSTSNHNSRYSDWLETFVVSYRNSTSNHNSTLKLGRVFTLYLIEILHQTTTLPYRSWLLLRCILSKFYIKPQHARCCFRFCRVVSYRNSTSNHNLYPVRIDFIKLYLIEILHQTTTSGLILIDKVLLTGCLPL